MNSQKSIIVFSEHGESHTLYRAFASQHNYFLYVKDRSKANLLTFIETKFDLIIIEILQPVMSEIDFVDQVKGFATDVPIVIVSSFFYDTKEIVFGKKIADFILKPFEFDLFSIKLQKILQRADRKEISPEVKDTRDIDYENKKLSVLFEISKCLNANRNFDDLLDQIIHLSADALNAERATLFLVDKVNNQLWSKIGMGLESKEIRIPLDSGIAGEVAVSGESQIIADPYSHPKFNRAVDKQTGFITKNILCIPMKNMQGEVIGVFEILNKRDDNFNDEDALFLSAMGASTGVAIENAILHDKLNQQLSEVKKAYDDLYIAQKTIAKESKLSTASEIIGFISSNLLNDESYELLINKIKESHKSEAGVNEMLDLLLSTYKKTKHKISVYLTSFNKNIS